MKISLSLIRSFLPIERSVHEIADTLTSLGMEVDHIHQARPSFSGVLCGKIETVSPHPHADKLCHITVSDGTRTHSLVCGDLSCRPGMHVALALPGALLTDLDGKQRQIQQTTIREVDSFGMLCSAAELGIHADNEGILDLPPDIPAGKDLSSLLWDPVFEISLTPNLGHCMSALGIARELSAAWQIPLLASTPTSAAAAPIPVHIEDPSLCPRYFCCLLQNVQIAPSPFWLKQVLQACGIQPICNAVDITNFILLKYGQPMHAFDFLCIEGSELFVHTAKEPFCFDGLDSVTHDVSPGMLLISDTKKPLALAGILGGKDSAISSDTQSILLECAAFSPSAIRRGIKKTGLRTESATRFEKGTDEEGIERALEEACSLFTELCQATRSTPSSLSPPTEKKRHTLSLRPQKVNQLLGMHLSMTEMQNLLERLGFSLLKQGETTLTFEVPSFRKDVKEEVDLIEEIARLYGYSHIPLSPPRYATPFLPHDPLFILESSVREQLVKQGLQEFVHCDLIGSELSQTTKALRPPKAQVLQTLHSKSGEKFHLRTTLLPGFLQSVKRNLDQKNPHIQAFEIGRIHFHQEKQIQEILTLGILLCGKPSTPHWSDKPLDPDFYDLKGHLETLLASFQVLSATFARACHPLFHPERQAELLLEGQAVGSIGELHPHLLSDFGIKQRAFYAEVSLERLFTPHRNSSTMKPLSSFPSSERDWTVSLPAKQEIAPFFSEFKTLTSPVLENVSLIDLYEPVDSAEKKATFRFTYRSPYKTLSFEEVEKEHAMLLDQIQPFLQKTS